MKNQKRSLLLLGVLCFSLAVVSAVWIIAASTTGVYQITSSPLEFGFTSHFSGSILDTTNGPVSFEDSAIAGIFDGVTEYQIGIEVLKTDLEDVCLDYETDCTLSFKAGLVGGSGFTGITDGQLIIFKAGSTEFVNTITCQQYSCPGEVSATISLTAQ